MMHPSFDGPPMECRSTTVLRMLASGVYVGRRPARQTDGRGNGCRPTGSNVSYVSAGCSHDIRSRSQVRDGCNRDGPRDLRAVGIRVNTIAPGLIDTPIYGEGEVAEGFKAKLGESVLFPHRLGDPEELASMVVELVTNSYMNAEVVRVDGGIRMPPK